MIDEDRIAALEQRVSLLELAEHGEFLVFRGWKYTQDCLFKDPKNGQLMTWQEALNVEKSRNPAGNSK